MENRLGRTASILAASALTSAEILLAAPLTADAQSVPNQPDYPNIPSPNLLQGVDFNPQYWSSSSALPGAEIDFLSQISEACEGNFSNGLNPSGNNAEKVTQSVTLRGFRYYWASVQA